MTQRLVVILCSDAFEKLWGALAERLAVDLVTFDEPAAAAGIRAMTTILACGGREAEAVDRLLEINAAGIGPALVVGAEADNRLAVQLMRAGAGGYFALPGDASRLESELIARRSEARGAPSPPPDHFDFRAIIGEHASLKLALERTARVIPAADATVLILGETGTGKELFARAIHDNGPRARDPFVAVNCSAVPGNLLESELFGHEKGSFTDARTAKPGLFELADGGTIFLDEISSMPVELQGKLLRFLETRELRRVGGLKSKPVNVRVLAAANEDLRALMRSGAFREDLYYRLAVIPIALPPLRERGDDILTLAHHFLAKLSLTYGVDEPNFTREAIRTMVGHTWPGNVRELRNAVERGLLLSGGAPISPDHLALEGASMDAASPASDAWGPLPFPATLEQIETAATLAMMKRCRGNKSEVARGLGITRSRLYRIIARASDEGVS